MKLVLKINEDDISEFCGMAYDYCNNNALDEYLNVYLTNPNFHAFQISSCGYFDLHQICYISEKISQYNRNWENNMFVKVDRDDDGKPLRYWVCFFKSEEQENGTESDTE